MKKEFPDWRTYSFVQSIHPIPFYKILPPFLPTSFLSCMILASFLILPCHMEIQLFSLSLLIPILLLATATWYFLFSPYFHFSSFSRIPRQGIILSSLLFSFFMSPFMLSSHPTSYMFFVDVKFLTLPPPHFLLISSAHSPFPFW